MIQEGLIDIAPEYQRHFVWDNTRQSQLNVTSLNEILFSRKLQNIWIETIEEIIAAFGMQILTLTPRTRATIDEIVGKRNAVAHGGESASYVGERHRANLKAKFQIAQDFMIEVIDNFEDY